MAGSDKVNPLARIRKSGSGISHRIDARMRGWPGMVVGAAGQAMKPDATIRAAAIAYFALFSLFPIILLGIAIASLIFDPLEGRQRIVQELEFITPGLGYLLGQNIDEILAARGPVTGIAVVGLIWSASTIFYTFTQALNDIWGSNAGRPVWKRRGLAILFVLILVGPVLFLASITGSLMANLRTWLPEPIVPVSVTLGLIVAIFLDIAMFMLLYSLLPHGESGWREILPGAIGAGLLWELAKKAFLFFVSNYLSISNLVYGSVAAMIAFLAWAYLSGLIFLFGAFLSLAYYRRKNP